MDTRTDFDSQPFFQSTTDQHKTELIALGSGKGGAGKTVISASMAAGLASMNKKVVVVDMDFGCANLYKVMGMDEPKTSCVEKIQNETGDLADVLVDHPVFPNLKVLRGSNSTSGINSITCFDKIKLIRKFKELDADYVILDLGSGRSENALDFFLAADIEICVVNPNPLSILECYNFIKHAFYRKVTLALKEYKGTLDTIHQLATQGENENPVTMKGILQEVTFKNERAGMVLMDLLSHFHPMLMVNDVKEKQDEMNARSIKTVALDLLSIEVDYLGAIHHDDAIPRSIQEHLPFVGYDPDSRASRKLMDMIAFRILKDEELPTQKVMPKNTKDTFKDSWKICSVSCAFWSACEFRSNGNEC